MEREDHAAKLQHCPNVSSNERSRSLIIFRRVKVAVSPLPPHHAFEIEIRFVSEIELNHKYK